MVRVYIADALPSERLALRLMLLDLNMEVAGEAEDWSITLAQTPTCHADILMLEWNLLPSVPSAALDELRKACPKALVIILIGSLADHRQAALSFGADVFISKGELPERVAEHLLAAAAKLTHPPSLA
jgi:DNA-binding NarL/FixJ family response regulator